MIKLTRLSETPILMPEESHAWEAAAVFNCAVIAHNGLIHMIYRATDVTSNGKEGAYVNNLGYAVSSDGLHFNRLVQPILTNDVPQELRGPEDPRLVRLDDTFYMTYTGYGGRFPGDYRICLASSPNLINWQRQGILLDEPNKDAALFPEKVNGRYAMLHRRPPDIWLAYSDDLLHWDNHTSIMQPVPGSSWESQKVGAAGPPIKTEQGWLLIYHGVSDDGRYSLGAALLSLDNPAQISQRQTEPVLKPVLSWEIQGYVPNVVFSCGQAIMGDELYVYYGGADTAIGVAALPLERFIF
ncbi:MAG: glycosidase [Chloroflexi bacterium]|nr:glycosidase [Chloroflexota bacterium]